jgi:hypothetical protein
MRWTQQQNQIIIGTLLGRSYITKPRGRTCFLTISEQNDLNWLKYKAYIIDSKKKTLTISGKKVVWRSSSDLIWSHIRNQFYNDKGKMIKSEILEPMHAEAIATWFLDKGFWNKERIGLKTTVFGIKGNKIIQKYFNEIDCHCVIRKDRGTARILFTHEGTKTFLKIIVNYIPSFMYYRLNFT